MALHEGKLSGLMLVPEEFEFVDEVTDAILTDDAEDDARDSNISMLHLVKDHDCNIYS